jgi:hypothetical protein
MRELQRIEFIEYDRETTFVSVPSAYTFKPTGRFQFLQRWALKFLLNSKVLAPYYRPDVKITSHTIDADSFMEKLFKMKHELFKEYRATGEWILIGSKDYAELMSTPEVARQIINFEADIAYGERIMGIRIRVVPWMSGIVLMPKF